MNDVWLLMMLHSMTWKHLIVHGKWAQARLKMLLTKMCLQIILLLQLTGQTVKWFHVLLFYCNDSV